MHRPLLLALAILCFAAGASAQTQDASARPRVHAVFVFDTHGHGIGEFVQRDRWNVLRTFHGGFRDAGQEQRLVKTVLEGQYATPANVVRAIQNLRPEPGDAVLVYYAGHGAIDAAKGHFLNMRSGKLLRTTVQAAMKRHKVRLSVLITESCAVVEPAGRFQMSMKPGAKVPTGNWETLSKLLLESSGTVDINSSRPNQEAIAGGDSGAFFTRCLTDVLCNPPTAGLTWKTAVAQAERGLRQVVPQDRQAVHVYAMREGGVAVARGKGPEEVSRVVTRTTLPPVDPNPGAEWTAQAHAGTR